MVLSSDYPGDFVLGLADEYSVPRTLMASTQQDVVRSPACLTKSVPHLLNHADESSVPRTPMVSTQQDFVRL